MGSPLLKDSGSSRPSIRSLARNNVDVIIAPNDFSTRTAQKATTTIPIVSIGFGKDPVAAGVVDSFGRPGGNVTGLYGLYFELDGKRLEILKETLPSVSRVAVLWGAGFGSPSDELQRAAQSLGLRLDLIEVRGPSDLEGAFKAATRKKAGAVLLRASPIFYVHRNRVAALSMDARLPTVAFLQQIVEAGGLLSYGADNPNTFRRAAYYVDRLLKGAKTERFASGAGVEPRLGCQSQDRQSTQHHHPGVDPAARGRSDQVTSAIVRHTDNLRTQCGIRSLSEQSRAGGDMKRGTHALLAFTAFLLIAIFCTGPGWAQTRIARVGILNNIDLRDWLSTMPFYKTLGEQGWVVGKNVTFEFCDSGNDPTHLAEPAAELIRLKVDVLFPLAPLQSALPSRRRKTFQSSLTISKPIL